LAAFSQELRSFAFCAAGFEADQQPDRLLGLDSALIRVQLAEQMVVQKAAEPITAHRALVNLAANHHTTAPGT
jgi:hypothetical protein